MHDEARRRLRAALEALTPPPGSLPLPALGGAAQPRPRGRWREATAAVAACLLVVAVVGSMLWLRGHGTGAAPASGGSPPPAVTAAPSELPSPAATAPGSTPPAAVAPPSSPTGTAPRCHTTDLTASLRPLNSGAGQRYAALDLADRSGHPCVVYGYVGMLLLDGDHRPLPTQVVRNASPGPQLVALAPGGTAFTVLHWTVVAGPGESQTAPCEPQPAAVEVTPPDETTQLVVPWSLDVVCLDGRIDAGALAPGTGPSF